MGIAQNWARYSLDWRESKRQSDCLGYTCYLKCVSSPKWPRHVATFSNPPEENPNTSQAFMPMSNIFDPCPIRNLSKAPSHKV